MSYSSMRIEIEELRERNSQLERDLEAERHHRHAVERSEDALAVYVHTLLEELGEIANSGHIPYEEWLESPEAIAKRLLKIGAAMSIGKIKAQRQVEGGE